MTLLTTSTHSDCGRKGKLRRITSVALSYYIHIGLPTVPNVPTSAGAPEVHRNAAGSLRPGFPSQLAGRGPNTQVDLRFRCSGRRRRVSTPSTGSGDHATHGVVRLPGSAGVQGGTVDHSPGLPAGMTARAAGDIPFAAAARRGMNENIPPVIRAGVDQSEVAPPDLFAPGSDQGTLVPTPLAPT